MNSDASKVARQLLIAVSMANGSLMSGFFHSLIPKYFPTSSFF